MQTYKYHRSCSCWMKKIRSPGSGQQQMRNHLQESLSVQVKVQDPPMCQRLTLNNIIQFAFSSGRSEEKYSRPEGCIYGNFPSGELILDPRLTGAPTGRLSSRNNKDPIHPALPAYLMQERYLLSLLTEGCATLYCWLLREMAVSNQDRFRIVEQ